MIYSQYAPRLYKPRTACGHVAEGNCPACEAEIEQLQQAILRHSMPGRRAIRAHVLQERRACYSRRKSFINNIAKGATNNETD